MLETLEEDNITCVAWSLSLVGNGNDGDDEDDSSECGDGDGDTVPNLQNTHNT